MKFLRRLFHRHDPVYPAYMTYTNAFCIECGFFPLPLKGARPMSEAESRQRH